MSSIIRILDDATINQIKAGEVVENPASVVKELVENSIDAGATSIFIEVMGSGRQLICVRDNGSGMTKEDALLCVERHATSKIRSPEDLTKLGTMGFRGEALPSIASVSKIKILTCTHSEKATLLLIEGGKNIQCLSTAAQQGTTVEVKSLFYNVPARRKFQKSLSHDGMEIVKVVSALALANPHIAFHFVLNGSLQFKTPASSQFKMRGEDVLGPLFLADLKEAFWETEGISIHGLFSEPAVTRPNRSGQYLFINGRPVFSPLIARAVLEGYGTLVTKGRYPNFLLHVRLPPPLVDVNVHPQKKEVRLREEGALFKAIAKTVEKAFFKEETVVPWSCALPKTIFATPAAHFSLPAKPVQESFLSPFRLIGIWSPYFLVDGASLLQPFDGILFVHQALAWKRICFEALQKESAPLQELLIPIKASFTQEEALRIEEKLDAFCKMGIHIRPFGPSTFLVDAISPTLAQEDVLSILQNSLSDEPSLLIARAACRRAPPLNLFEATSLLEKLWKCETPSYCPDGKPIFFFLKRDAIHA